MRRRCRQKGAGLDAMGLEEPDDVGPVKAGVWRTVIAKGTRGLRLGAPRRINRSSGGTKRPAEVSKLGAAAR